MTPRTIKANALQLGDTVRRKGCEMPFGTATVKQIKDGHAHLFRPYVHTNDFSYTGGVICYIGTETYPVPLNNEEWILLDRKILK